MSMGMVGSNLQTMAPIKVEPNQTSPSASGSGQSQQPQESYLNLLAQLAKRESEERMNKSNNNNESMWKILMIILVMKKKCLPMKIITITMLMRITMIIIFLFFQPRRNLQSRELSYGSSKSTNTDTGNQRRNSRPIMT